MRKLFFVILVLLSISNMTFAYDFVSTGIYYKIYGTEVAVTSCGSASSSYSGSVIVPTSVTYSGRNYPVTAVDTSAFENAVNLSSITLPSSLKRICSDAFSGCSRLSSITIPASVKKIEKRCFESCSSLKRVDFQCDSVYIEKNAFRDDSNINYVNCKNIQSYLKYRFTDSESNPVRFSKFLYVNGSLLQNLVIPDDIELINSYAFEYCDCIVSVVLSSNTKRVAKDAFSGCQQIKSVEIRNEHGTIFEKDWLSNAPEILNYSSLSAVLQSSFESYFYADRSAPKILVQGNEVVNLVIPETVTTIGKYAFYNSETLKSVEIPNSVVRICQNAFSGCKNLEEVFIPNSVKYIDSYAFCDCSSLKYFNVPSSLALQQDAANACGFYRFMGMTGTVYIDQMPYSTSDFRINSWFASSRIEFSHIIIGDNVKRITDYSFRNKRFKKVEFSKNLESIGREVLTSGVDTVICRAQTPPSISSGTNFSSTIAFVPQESIDLYRNDSQWSKCQQIFPLTVYEDNIGFKEYKTKLKCLKLWDSNRDGELSVAEASRVKDISPLVKESMSIRSFDEFEYFIGITSVPSNCFEGCSELLSCTMPRTVKEICDKAFSGCTKLGSIVINEGCERIGSSSFANCKSLRLIEFPSTLNVLKDKALAGCTNIDSISCYAVLPPTTYGTGLTSIDSKCRITVPLESTDNYLETHPWGRYLINGKTAESVPSLNKTGDANGDNTINIWDISDCADMLLGKSARKPYGDINKDGKISIQDITKLIELIRDNHDSQKDEREVTLDFASGKPVVTVPIACEHQVVVLEDDNSYSIYNENTSKKLYFRFRGDTKGKSIRYYGNYKTRFYLDGVTIKAKTGPALDIRSGKLCEINLCGKTNYLEDGVGGDHKAALYCKGHIEMEGSGKLVVKGNSGHAIATREYFEMKEFTGDICIQGAISDALHIGEYFSMSGGTLNIDENTLGDGIQVEAKETNDGSEPSLDYEQIRINGGNISITISQQDKKGIKCDANAFIYGGDISIIAKGNGSRGIQVGKSLVIGSDFYNPIINVLAQGRKCTLPEDREDPHRCVGVKVDGGLVMYSGSLTVNATGSKSRSIQVPFGGYTKTGGNIAVDPAITYK